MEFQSENLKSSHHREDFCCGNDSLDDYLKRQANQDVQKKLAVCFVIIELDGQQNKVIGYYTLSNEGISRESIPEKYQKKFLKSYKSIPSTLLGRLARDKNISGKRVGEFLLLDALYKCYISAKEVASFAVVVDPIDETAKSFYEKYGFKLLPDSERMFLPMKTVDELFA